MKTIYLSLMLTLLFANNAFTQQFDWAHSIGSTFGGSEDYVASAVDNAGNVVLVGNYSYEMDLDFGADTSMVSSNNGGIYIAKYTSAGIYLWHEEIQSPTNTAGIYANAVTTDLNNNIFVTGRFNSTIDFDPGPGVTSHASTGGSSIYTLKFSASGNYSWVQVTNNVPGNTGHNNSTSITTDSNGDVYSAGYIKTAVDFNPTGTSMIRTSNGGEDAFVVKYSATGVIQWIDAWGGTGDDACHSVGFHPVSGLYVSGYFSDTVDVDPGPGIALFNSAGGKDGFLTKILPNTGTVPLVRQIGGPANDIIYDFDFDLSGDLVLTGVFSGTADLSPSPSVANFTSNGALDAFVIKVDPSGYVFWIKRFGGNGDDYARKVSLDGDLSIAIAGDFQYQGDFETDENSDYNLSTNNEFDAYALMLDGVGNFSWVHQFGINGFEYGTNVNNLGNNEVLFSGYFSQGIDLNPGTGSSVANALSWDGFVVKLNNCPNLSGSSVIGACVSYTSSLGTVWTSSGTYTESYLSNLGCDSTHITNLIINYPVLFSDTVSTCDDYFWVVNSTSYTTSGVYDALFTNIHGCDSMHTLYLTINSSSLIEETIVACESYTWPFNNTTFTTSGIYDEAFVSQAGCDSTHRLKLTIFEPPSISISLENSILTADSTGYDYQWINCADNSMIVGETNQNYTPSETGIYAVILTNGSCIDTTQCVAVGSVGIHSAFQIAGFKIYPNPSKNFFNLELENQEGYSLEILDVTSKIIYSKNELDGSEIIDLSNTNSGIYFLRLQNEKGQYFTSKLVKL